MGAKRKKQSKVKRDLSRIRKVNVSATVVKVSARAEIEFTGRVDKAGYRATYFGSELGDIGAEKIVEVRERVLSEGQRRAFFARLIEKNVEPEPKEELVTFSTLMFIGSLIYPRSTRDVELGDLEEKYNNNVRKFGVGRAKAITAWDLSRSVLPHVVGFLRKAFSWVLKLVGIKLLAKFFFG